MKRFIERLWFDQEQWSELRRFIKEDKLTLREIHKQTGTDLRNQIYKGYSVRTSALTSLNKITSFNVFAVLGNPMKKEKLAYISSLNITGKLAEFVGIVLGDGHLSKKAIVITLNSAEIEYAVYTQTLVKTLFGLKARIYPILGNAIQLKIFSKALVDRLVEIGLKRGNKVKQQVGVPPVLIPKYSCDVIRGLFDTDGSIYLKSHKYLNLSYTSYSKPLLLFFNQFCEDLSIRTYLKERDVLIQSKQSVHKFLSVVRPFKGKDQII